MSTTSIATMPPGSVRGGIRPAALVLAGAITFPASYVAIDVVNSAVASAPLPMPDAPAGEMQAYLAENQLAVILAGLCLVVSAAGLLGFVRGVLRCRDASAGSAQARWADTSGLLAVLALLVAATLNFVLVASASAVSPETIGVLRTANFLAGGVVHVVCLGAFVRLTSVAFPARGLRAFAWVAAVPAVLSIASLVFFYANALILLGRLLSMLWILVAAISVLRRARREAR